MKWRRDDKQLLYLVEQYIFYNGKDLGRLDFHTADLTVGQSVGILLTEERDLHWFVDGQWRGVVHVDDYPLDGPMWGVVDVCEQCKQVRADIHTGKLYTVLCMPGIPCNSYFSRELNFANESSKAFRSFKFHGITDCSMSHPSRKDIPRFLFSLIGYKNPQNP